MQVSFVLASARDPDMPIVYASASFYELTGYGPQDVLGRNCRYNLKPLASPGFTYGLICFSRTAICRARARSARVAPAFTL